MTPEGERVAGILLAAGSSTRMGHDKLWAPLGGRPLLAWPLRAMGQCDAIDDLILVVAAAAQARARELLRDLDITAAVVPGGPQRRDSVRAGLEAVDRAQWVVIHDAARPLVSSGLILRGLEAARATGAAVAAVPEVDTVKEVADGVVVRTLERGRLWKVQTPQVFRREVLLAAHAGSTGEAADDAALVEALGVPVRVYEGAYANIKVTTPVDERLVAVQLKEDHGPVFSEGVARANVRIGLGHDLHPLVAGRSLVLGGVRIPYPRGLQGHSDGDVLAHAVADALIGAAGEGDLGRWFPETDPQYRGADSVGLLRDVVSSLAQKGWRVSNVDASVVAQQPRLAPHLEEMRANLARALDVETSCVNVKATSPEGVGSLGREDAIAAFATALLEREPGTDA